MKDGNRFIDIMHVIIGFVFGIVVMVVIMDATGFFNLG
jgi:hypothetical protein